MSELFLTILNMSLTASYVILFVMLVRLLLRKAPKFISYALWGIVAFRLIVPFSFESIFSLMPRNANVAPIPHDIIYQQSPQINSGIKAVDTFVNKSLPAPAPVASANPLQIYTEIGSYIWVLGIIMLLVYSLTSVMILKRRLKGAQFIEKNIYEAKNLKTPFVLGLIRPRIYLPVGLNAEERSYILLHEQAHIHRKDNIMKVFAFLILALHWFNPLVWIAFVLMSTDMELSCDERVLKEINEDIKKPYANSLLSLAAARHILNGSPLAFGEGNVKGRIMNVLNYKKPKFWFFVISIIIVISVGIGLIANPKAKETDTASNPIVNEDLQSELIYKADVNEDGKEEFISIIRSQTDIYLPATLSICDSSSNEIWSKQFSTSHVGWGSLFLCELDGKQYLLDYDPYMGQGYAEYEYTLFTLDGGKTKVNRSNTLEFDINGVTELNPPKMVAFAEEVNELLGKSILLMSTEGGEIYIGPTSADPFFERYSWLDNIPGLYDSKDDLETKLVKYSKYMSSNRASAMPGELQKDNPEGDKLIESFMNAVQLPDVYLENAALLPEVHWETSNKTNQPQKGAAVSIPSGRPVLAFLPTRPREEKSIYIDEATLKTMIKEISSAKVLSNSSQINWAQADFQDYRLNLYVLTNGDVYNRISL